MKTNAQLLLEMQETVDRMRALSDDLRDRITELHRIMDLFKLDIIERGCTHRRVTRLERNLAAIHEGLTGRAVDRVTDVRICTRLLVKYYRQLHAIDYALKGLT